MRELIRYAKTPRYPCNTQSPQLGFNELDVQFSRSKLGHERIRGSCCAWAFWSCRSVLWLRAENFEASGVGILGSRVALCILRPARSPLAGTANCTFCARHWKASWLPHHLRFMSGLTLKVLWEGRQSRLCTAQSPKLPVTIQNSTPCSAWLTLFELVGCGSNV